LYISTPSAASNVKLSVAAHIANMNPSLTPGGTVGIGWVGEQGGRVEPVKGKEVYE
jgi:hypothetical protein